MAITYIPPQKNWIDKFTEGMAPYLQAAFAEKLRKASESEKEEQTIKKEERKAERDKSTRQEELRMFAKVANVDLPEDFFGTNKTTPSPPPIQKEDYQIPEVGLRSIQQIPQQQTSELPSTVPSSIPQSMQKATGVGQTTKPQLDVLPSFSGGKMNLSLQKRAISPREKIKTEATGKIETGKRTAFSNLELVSGAFTEMAKTYVDAVKEGGMGSKLAQIKSGLGLWAGGEVGENFPATAAWVGLQTEVVARMMPMLTQQGEKPGSVRLVATVFDKLTRTTPEGNTPPKNARRMMETTLRNMYRFARAANQLGITNEVIENTPNAKLENISKQIAALADRIEIKDEEKENLDNLLGTILKPIDLLIMERSGSSEKSLLQKLAIEEAKKRGIL